MLLNELLLKPKKEKKTKKVDKLPKAQNSYMEFCKETRKNTDFSETRDPKEVSRRLGAMWRELDETAREVYKKRAAENKDRYNEALRNSGEKVDDAKDYSPVTPPSSPVKRPLTPYIRFCNATRTDIAKTGVSPQDVSRRLGEMWRGLDEHDKQRWSNDVKDDVEAAKIEPVVEKKKAKK